MTLFRLPKYCAEVELRDYKQVSSAITTFDPQTLPLSIDPIRSIARLPPLPVGALTETSAIFRGSSDLRATLQLCDPAVGSRIVGSGIWLGSRFDPESRRSYVIWNRMLRGAFEGVSLAVDRSGMRLT